MTLLLLAVVGLLLAAAPASAYVDPSAGSILLQLVLGGVAGVSVIAKLYYRRLVLFLRGRRAGDGEAGDDAQRIR